MVYDNLKPAVVAILTGHSRREQAAFTHFKSVYQFEAVFANPADGGYLVGASAGISGTFGALVILYGLFQRGQRPLGVVRLAILWTGRNSSTCGRIAFMPNDLGAKPS